MLNPFQNDLPYLIHSGDHQRGNPNGNVRIVVYADFADPQIQAIHATLEAIIKSSGDHALIVYRHFPQVLKYPYAYAVAQALEAAAKQDKFWEMLAKILAHHDKLSDGYLRQYAREIELDKAQFEDDFSHIGTIKRIEHDLQTAKDRNIEYAPAIFINGIKQNTLSMRYIKELMA